MMTKQRQIGRAVAGAAAVLTTALAMSCGSLESSNDSKRPADSQVSTQQSSAKTPASASASVPARTSTSAAPTSAASGGGSDDSASGVPECRAADLSLSLGHGDAAAGTVYRPLVFTNKSDSTCTMIGYPGVSYVAGDNGRQVGSSALRTGGNRVPITLAPGEVASATVGFTEVDNFDVTACKKTKVRGLRVYPPHDTAAMFLADPGYGCAGSVPGSQLQVKMVVKGRSGM